MNELIEKYRNFVQNQNEKEPFEKVEIVTELEDEYLKTDNKEVKREILDFFFNLAQDIGEYDMARIEVFKILNVLKLDELESEKLMETIEATLKNETDDVVRQYSTFPLAKFPKSNLGIMISKKLLLDEEEDESVRYNALEALKRTGLKGELENIFYQLVEESDVKRSISRIIGEM